MKRSDIEKASVIGGGIMGFGVAINFARNGYPTVIHDLNDRILEQSKKSVQSALALFVEEELITRSQSDDTLGRISWTTDLTEAAASDFITEAIVERLKDKQELFNTLDKICPSHTIIVSNTSGLVLSDIGAGVRRQDKIAVTHYFAPSHIVPGVEVAKGPGTSDETYEIVYNLMKKVKKIPIRVLKELPGYLLNRMQNALSAEVNRLWAEGVATAEEIELGIKTTFGFRMPHEGSMGHYDVCGVWKWPADIRTPWLFKPDSQPVNESTKKIRARFEEGKPWFFAPDQFEEALEKRDREYVRRLKSLYGSDLA